MTTPALRYQNAVKRLAQLNPRLPAAIAGLNNAVDGQPGSQTFDPLGRSNMTTVLWCDTHDRELADCHRNDDTCTQGTTIPVHVDPTGDAAEGDRARSRLGELDRRLTALENTVRWIDDFIHDNHPQPPRKANPVESKKAEQDNAKQGPLCQVCVKSGKAVDVAGAITVDDVILLVCTFHKGFHQRHGRLPNDREEATHQRGKRVTARVSQTDRFARGVLTGKLD